MSAEKSKKSPVELVVKAPTISSGPEEIRLRPLYYELWLVGEGSSEVVVTTTIGDDARDFQVGPKDSDVPIGFEESERVLVAYIGMAGMPAQQNPLSRKTYLLKRDEELRVSMTCETGGEKFAFNSLLSF